MRLILNPREEHVKIFTQVIKSFSSQNVIARKMVQSTALLQCHDIVRTMQERYMYGGIRTSSHQELARGIAKVDGVKHISIQWYKPNGIWI